MHDYIAAATPLVAPQIIKRLILRSRQLQTTPWSGRKVPEYQRDDVRELLDPPYRIFYWVHSDRVDVLTVRHYRPLLPSDLTEV